MSLDQRAARAVDGIHRSIAGAPLLLMRRQPIRRRTPVTAFAIAFTMVVFLAGLVLGPSRWLADTVTSPVTTSAVLVPPPVVVPQVPSTTTTAPVPSTTTTSQVPTTSVPKAPAVVDRTPPWITVGTPEPGWHSSEKTILFEGSTEPGAVVTAGRYQADVTADGHWSIVLVLSPGGNLARFTATDGAGNTADATVEVFYDKPEAPSAFTAHATWGSCELNPPYDEYYGTGKPGTVVVVQSEFGSGDVVVGESGEWYVKVIFETAPYGEPFMVKVKDAFGHSKVFEFTSYAG